MDCLESINWPQAVSILISVVTIILIVNAFNLIDGINGFTALLSILITSFLSAWFYLVDQDALSLIAFSTTGACFAFLYYNMTPAKIFMGDTGSLFIGLICAILSIEFIEINRTLSESIFIVHNAPVVAMGIIALPVFDTLRLFALRLLKGRSPFSADRLHIHHLATDAGLTHMEAAILLTAFNAAIIYIMLLGRHLEIHLLLFILIGVYFAFTGGLYYFARLKNQTLYFSENSKSIPQSE